jgi:hypothetical protein
MSCNTRTYRPRLERLEGRDAPAVAAAVIDWPAGAGEAIAVQTASDHSKASDAGSAIGNNQIAIGEIDEVPLRVSLTAVIVIALGVGWDRHIRERRPALRDKLSQMLSSAS